MGHPPASESLILSVLATPSTETADSVRCSPVPRHTQRRAHETVARNGFARFRGR